MLWEIRVVLLFDIDAKVIYGADQRCEVESSESEEKSMAASLGKSETPQQFLPKGLV